MKIAELKVTEVSLWQ